MSDWKDKPANNLEAAIAKFKLDLPGWWYSVCECEKTCDASCGPTRESPFCDIEFFVQDDRFDNGFDADLPQPSSLATALHKVRAVALQAIKELKR